MSDNQQAVRDQEHLNILKWCYYIVGGIEALLGLFPLIYILLGGLMLAGGFSESSGDAAELRTVGGMFIGLGLVITLFIQAFALSKIFAGRWISQRRLRVPVMVVAAVTCLSIPYGTVLGIFTFIVLGRDSVAALFEGGGSSTPTTTD